MRLREKMPVKLSSFVIRISFDIRHSEFVIDIDLVSRLCAAVQTCRDHAQHFPCALPVPGVPMNLILIGYRGTGKTTVARILSERLGWPWVDSDDEIEAAAGKSIAEIFAAEGEPAFRDWESRVLANLLSDDRHILALGGGAVLGERNRDLLAAADGKIVWLTASPETIHQRITSDATTSLRRPDLTPEGGITEITRLLAQRGPIYRQCADAAVDTEGKTPVQVATEILQSIGPANLV